MVKIVGCDSDGRKEKMREGKKTSRRELGEWMLSLASFYNVDRKGKEKKFPAKSVD